MNRKGIKMNHDAIGKRSVFPPTVCNGILALVTILAALALAPGAAVASAPRPSAPLLDIGGFNHPISTSSKQAQRFFNQGVAMMFGFNHMEAIRSFQAAAELDPDCAMAWWGVACAYGPNINAPMTEDAGPKAWAALQKARALMGKASAREQDYIRALSHRYQEEWVEDRSALDQAYADAMRDVVKKHPDDLLAATLFAESIMDTMPWDYWTKDKEPKPATRELLSTLESVLKRDPKQPGANHLYIHAVEAGPTPEQGLPSADRLGKLVPDSGHLVHMPSHIYLRVGQYHDATVANEKAVRVDEDYIAHCRAEGFYPGVYYSHNVHFLWYTYSMEGRSEDCIREARKIARYTYDNVCGPATVVEAPRFRHLPLLALARFGRWEEVLRERVPAGGHLFDKAVWHYTRGLAHLGQSDLAAAEKELKELDACAASEEAKSIDTPYFPGTRLLAISRHILAAKVHQARGETEAMERSFAQALEEEVQVPYMEPPYWYYPVRLSLGAALLKSGQAEKAEQVFRRSLEDHPNNGWSWHGLSESLRAQDDRREARRMARRFKAAWKHADLKPDLSWY